MKKLLEILPLIGTGASVIIALAVFATFLGSQINQLDNRISSQINRLDDRISSRIEGIDNRLTQVENRLTEVVKEVAFIKGFIRLQEEPLVPKTAITSDPPKDTAQTALVSGRSPMDGGMGQARPGLKDRDNAP